MSARPVIMVQIEDRAWTLEALHCACRLARYKSAKIELVAMIQVPYTSWLGTNLGYMNFTEQDRVNFADYQVTIEDYGVECEPLLFQYVSLSGATAQVAEQINARIIFAQMSESIIPFWKRLQSWLLKCQFAQQNRQWIQYPVHYSEASASVTETTSDMNSLYRHHIIR